MTSPYAVLALASVVTAVGLWWLLPGSGMRQRVFGGLLAAVGFGLFSSQAPIVGDWLAESLFAAIALATVVAAVATISCRSPVYCAIWFGMTLTGTAGLFLLAGAEFLAVATTGRLRRRDPRHLPLRAHALAARRSHDLRPPQLGSDDFGLHRRGAGGRPHGDD